MQKAMGMYLGIRIGLSLMAGALISVGIAQDPSYRPSLVWHKAATIGHYPAAFTETGDYLLLAPLNFPDPGLLMVYRTADVLNPNTRKGDGLVSYDYGGSYSGYTFTDRDETNQDYVVGFAANSIQVWRWVRNAGVFRGGYLEKPKSWTVSGWTTTALVLRGERTDRRYNRLLVSGDASGNLRIVLLDYGASSQSAVLVSGAHGLAVSALAYDPATRRLVSGGADGLIRVWQVGIDGSGNPTLSHVQTVAGHGGRVYSLVFATVGSTRYLVSLSGDGEIAGWSWPSLSAVPLWHKPLESSFLWDNYLRVELYGLTPYGDLRWVAGYGVNQVGGTEFYGWAFLIDPATGNLHYRAFVRGASPSQPRMGFLVSPSIGGVRYLVDSTTRPYGYYGTYGALGISAMPSLEPVQAIASAPFLCTALDTMQSGSTRYLAAGYAGGEVRLYRNTGSGWTLWDSSGALHPGSRVVGIEVFQQGSNIYTLSADSEGRLVVAQHTGSVTSVLSQASGLSSAQALAWGQDATSTLVAVCGHQDGAPRVEVFRLSWSGSTPSLTPLAGFTVSGEGAPANAVAFVRNGSADVVVSTATRVSRWNFASNAYSRALNFDDISLTSLSVAGNRVWMFGYYWVPLVEDVDSGATVWDRAVFQGTDSAPGLALDSENGVWGLIRRAGSQDTSYWLMRGRGLYGGVAQSQAYNVMEPGFQARLPEAMQCIARDPSNSDLFYVGCLDGSIQQVVLPRLNRVQIGYAGLSGTLFEAVQDRVATFLTGWADAMTYSGGDTGVGIRHAAVLRTSDGSISSQAMLCNASGTTGCDPRDVGINALMRLSPSGNVLYGYEVNNARLTGWNGTTMALLFNTTSFPSHWWPVGLDDSRVALLYTEARGSYQIGTTTYYRFRPVIRVVRWTPSLTTEATRPLDENTEMGFIMTNPSLAYNYLSGVRWDMNANRRVAAVYGVHYYDPNTPSAYRRRVLILHRPNAGDWGTWVLRGVLEQDTDFPSGVYPTLVRFHPNAPNVLYVGLSNGRLRIYRLDANGNLLNRTNPDELVPTLGSLGPISALDVGNYVLNGLNYTVMVFGGPEGLSVWVGFVCQPGWLNEVHFYQTDIAFFPSAGMGYIQVSQSSVDSWPFLIYSNGYVMSAARLENLPLLPCPEDVNRDGMVDDTDILEVLFAFGGEGFNRADVNCDGLVDDSDLLQVLFVFGQSC